MSLVAPLVARAQHRVRDLWREVAKFGAVGALAFLIDNGGYTLLVFALPGGHGPLSQWPVTASVLATAAATGFSWVGNRYWTYRHQRRPDIAQELGLFIVVNVVGIAITAGAVWSSRHVLGFDSVGSDNLARITGWLFATLLRFVCYRHYVFVGARN